MAPRMKDIISIKRPYKPSYDGVFVLTSHVKKRMSERGISRKAAAAVLKYGHVYRIPGTLIYMLRRKDVAAWRRRGLNLEKHLNIQVIVAADTGEIITVYRNSSIRHPLKKFAPRPSRRSAVVEGTENPEPDSPPAPDVPPDFDASPETDAPPDSLEPSPI